MRLTNIPDFLKATPERIAKAQREMAAEREERQRWIMPGEDNMAKRKENQPPKDWSAGIDPNLIEVAKALGHDLTTRDGHRNVLTIADDPAKAREFLTALPVTIFTGSAVEVTDEEAQAQAEMVLREQLKLPDVKGDPEMAKAKKVVKKAKKVPKVKKERKAGTGKAGTGKAGTGKAGTGKGIGICAEVLRMVERTNGATTGEIHELVCKKFPDRDPVKLYNTVRGELQNMPKRLKRKMKKYKEDGRKGTIYALS